MSSTSISCSPRLEAPHLVALTSPERGLDTLVSFPDFLGPPAGKTPGAQSGLLREVGSLGPTPSVV